MKIKQNTKKRDGKRHKNEANSSKRERKTVIIMQ
jgi:hypothetical protein